MPALAVPKAMEKIGIGRKGHLVFETSRFWVAKATTPHFQNHSMFSLLRAWLERFPRLGERSERVTAAGADRPGGAEHREQLLGFLLDRAEELIFWTDSRGRFLDANVAVCNFLGYSRQELVGMELSDVAPAFASQSNQSLSIQLTSSPTVTLQTQVLTKGGSLAIMECTFRRFVTSDRVYLCSVGHEIVIQQQLRKRVLEAIATGMPLEQILLLIIEMAEKTRAGMLGSIMLLDKSGCLRVRANRQLPKSYCDRIDGIRPGPRTGSCGTAVHEQRRILVSNISESHLWKDYVSIAESAGVQACWSEPILSSNDEILGSLAMYFRYPQSPAQNDVEMLQTLAQLASIAIERATAHETVSQREHQLRTITDSLPVMIAYLDTHYRFQFNNAKHEARFKLSRDEINGKHLRDLIGDKRFREVKHHFDLALGGAETAYEHHYEGREGGSHVSQVRLVPDKSNGGTVVGVNVLVDDITERRRLENEVLNIAEYEQRRIGQDLHDGTGQELTGLGLIADTLVTSLKTNSPKDQKIAEKLARGIKRCLSQVRSVARGLNPIDVSADGLRSALMDMAAQVESLYEIRCHLEFDAETKLHDHHMATQLFRIAQEATTNAIKHGQAANVHIQLRIVESELVLSILDDGQGFQQPLSDSSGIGLKTMSYRAGVIGGRLEISAGESRGVRIRCRLPQNLRQTSIHAPADALPSPHQPGVAENHFPPDRS